MEGTGEIRAHHVDAHGFHAVPVGLPMSAPLLEKLRIPMIDYGNSQILLEPCPKRVRAYVGGVPVIDSIQALMMCEPQHLPVYLFPQRDTRMDLLSARESSDDTGLKGKATLWTLQVGERIVQDALVSYDRPELSGLIGMYWSRMDSVFEEDEEVFVHARHPGQRIETLRTSRNVRVVSQGQILAETDRAVMLLETHLPPRFYIPKLDCRLEVMAPSPTQSACPYKGRATQYWSAGDLADVAWCYPAPTLQCTPIANHIAFFQERVEIWVDGEVMAQPATEWS